MFAAERFPATRLTPRAAGGAARRSPAARPAHLARPARLPAVATAGATVGAGDDASRSAGPVPALWAAAAAAAAGVARRAAKLAALASAAAAPADLALGHGLESRVKLAAAAAPLCFASVGLGAGATLPLITSAVASFIKLYLLLLFVRVLLTWFPNVNWMGQPWLTLRQITDPYLNLFRNLIPPLMGQVDLTPIIGFMVLQFLAGVLQTDDNLYGL